MERTTSTPGDPGRAPELSVIVVSFRCADFLRDCLASLERQRDTVALETFVVDNASGDQTVDVPARFPWVTAMPLDHNEGFARANNRALRRARGRAVLFLNPDTRLPDGCLRRCLDELWGNPAVGILGPRIVDADGRFDRRARRGFPTAWGMFCFATGLDRVLPDRRSRAYTMGHLPEDRPCDPDAVSGAFMLCRAEALRETGGFDERFFMYAEDIDLCRRVSDAGWRVRFWPRAEVVHVGAGSNVDGRRPPQANAAFYRSLAKLVRKHRRGLRGRIAGGGWFVAAEALVAWSRVRAHRRARRIRSP